MPELDAYGNPIDPALSGSLVDPWSWVPESWTPAPAPEPAPMLQPGLDIPTQTLDALPLPEQPVAFPSPASVLDDGLSGLAPPALPPASVTSIPAPDDDLLYAELPGSPRLPDPLNEAPPDFSGHVPDDYTNLVSTPDTNTGVANYLSLSPTERILLDGKQAAAQQTEMAAARTRAATADLEQAEANQKAFRESRAAAMTERAAIEADAKKLAEERVDPDGWMNSRSTFQKIAAFSAAIIGGLAAGRSGGPNVGMQMIEKQIDNHIAAQRENLAARRADIGRRTGVVNDNLGEAQTDLRTEEAFRASAWERTIQDLQAQAQEYDPHGTTAIRIGKSIIDMRARQAGALEAATDKAQKTMFEAMKIDQEQQKIDNAKIAKGGSGVGGGSGKAADTVMLSPAELAGLGIQSDVPMSMKEARARQGLVKTAQDIKQGEHAIGAEQRTAERERAMPGVFDGVDENGKPKVFIPTGTPAAVEKLQAKSIATREIVNLLDEAMSLRTGWTTDRGNSDENQKLTAIMGKIKLRVKDAEDLGAITAADADLIVGAVGTDDFTKYADMKAAVGQGRQNMIGSLRNEFVGRGMSKEAAAKFSIGNPHQAATTKSEADRAYKGLLEDDGSSATDNPAPAAQQTLLSLRADAFGTDPAKRAAAIKALEDIAKTSKGNANRAAASFYLRDANTRIATLATVEKMSPDAQAEWHRNNPDWTKP
ncbi:MAG: hypothetical protein H0V17_31110 [Deltaproteobacteria bacterium]|nr:hypothetical protein [Deltaproteobacteria bacterium]